MSVISISTPFNIDLELAIAPLWKRFLAWLVDTFIQGLYFLGFVTVLFGSVDEINMSRSTSMVLFSVFCLLPLALYHFLSELFMSGQSIGKKLLQIRVVNALGNEASISQYLIRLLFRSMALIPFLSAILGELFGAEAIMGYFMLILLAIGIFILFITSPKGQRIGDRLADTLVIEKKAEANIHKTIFREVSDVNYKAMYPEVMRLSDRDINGIRNLLTMKHSRDSDAYIERISERVIGILGIETQASPRELLEQLLLDYNFLSKS